MVEGRKGGGEEGGRGGEGGDSAKTLVGLLPCADIPLKHTPAVHSLTLICTATHTL